MHSERMAFVHRDQVRLVHMDSDGFRAKGRRVHRYPYMSLSGISVPPYLPTHSTNKYPVRPVMGIDMTEESS
jgi:hypothetical protein